MTMKLSGEIVRQKLLFDDRKCVDDVIRRGNHTAILGKVAKVGGNINPIQTRGWGGGGVWSPRQL